MRFLRITLHSRFFFCAHATISRVEFFVFTYSSFNTGRCCCCCTLYCFSKNLSSYILHLSQIKSDWLSACVQNCSLSIHCSRDRFSFSVADRWCFFLENLDFSAELQARCMLCYFLWVSWRVWSFDMTSGAASRRAAKLDGALKRSDTLSQLLKFRRYDDDEKWCVIKSFNPCSLLTSSCYSRAEPTNLDEIEPWRNAVFSLGLRINLFPFPTTTLFFLSLCSVSCHTKSLELMHRSERG